MNYRLSAMILLFAITMSHAYGQKVNANLEDTVYYNLKWNRCSSYAARYYCLPILMNDRYAVTYYTVGHVMRYKGAVKVNEKGLLYSIDPETAIKDGYFEYYSPAGYKISEGNFINNLHAGTWKSYFDTTGKLQAIREYDQSERLGFITYYHDDGEAIMSSGYVKGITIKADVKYMREGEWIYYYKSPEKVLARVYFSAGALDGHSVFYDSGTGSKVAEGRFTYGTKSGRWVYYDPNTKQREAIINYYRGVPNGEFYVFHIPSGRLKTTGSFVNGTRTGLWSGLYDYTDLVYWQVEYRNNKGHITYYDSVNNNREILEGNLEGNSREGIWTGYYPGNGKLKYKESYEENILHGEIINYNEDGSISSELLFYDGQLNGTSTYYYKDSKSKWVTIEYIGDEMEQLKAYYPSNKLKRIEDKTGVRKCYEEDGSIIECEPFRTDASFDGDVMTYIGDHLKYPEEVKLAGLEGKVKVGFMVDEWGSVRDPYIIEGFDDRCDREALRLVSQMPNWIPAKVDGIPIQTHKTLPIVFWLPPDEHEAAESGTGM